MSPYGSLDEARTRLVVRDNWASRWTAAWQINGSEVVHAVDCVEAPKDAPRLGWDRALEVAEQLGVRLCSLCGAAA